MAAAIGQKAASLFRSPNGTKNSYRNIFAFLNPIFNKVDNDRIKECGPDRAAAEWLIRCGAAVRWKGMQSYFDDYNKMPPGRIYIEAINANNSCIMHLGFPYLKDLMHLREFNLTDCKYIDDGCLRLLVHFQKERLERLKIDSCGNITDNGLQSLTELKALKSLYLSNLLSVKDKQNCINILQRALPDCQIDFSDSSQPK